MPPLGASGAPAAANAEYREEAAFASVHDLVHYAIISCPAQRCARRRPPPSSPSRNTRSETRAVARFTTAHDTNSADHRLPPLDAQGLAPPGVPHMRDPGAHRPQAYVPAAFLAPRASSPPVAAAPRTRPPRAAVAVFPSRLVHCRTLASMKLDTLTTAIFCRFADASRARLVFLCRRRRLAAPDRERALEEPDPPRAVHVPPIHARGGGRGRLARLQPRRAGARDHRRARLPRRRARVRPRQAARAAAQTQARLGGGGRRRARSRALRRAGHRVVS